MSICWSRPLTQQVAQGAKQDVHGGGATIQSFGQDLSIPLTTAGQMAVVLHSLTTLMQQTMQVMMSRNLEWFITQLGTSKPPGGHSGGLGMWESAMATKVRGPSGRSSARATIKQCDVALFEALELAGGFEIEVTKAHVEGISMDRQLEKSATPCHRLIHVRVVPSLNLHLSVVEQNGQEAWRSLKKKYEPKTTLRNFSNRWESWVNTLRREYGQDVADISS